MARIKDDNDEIKCGNDGSGVVEGWKRRGANVGEKLRAEDPRTREDSDE